MKANKVNEIMNGFTAFTKTAYYNGEELTELFKLQEEIVRFAFNGSEADCENLKIWDVERLLEKMNEDCNGAADAELKKFEEDCKDLCNMIKGIISGSRGEAKAFRILEGIRSHKRILKNVELNRNSISTELDAIVITKGGAYIVEVKNTVKDIFIDAEGNYYRTGEYLRWDSNIGAKMTLREELLRSILIRAGYEEIPVKGVVVFTNDRIEVRNCCSKFTTCFLSQLPYIIGANTNQVFLSESDIEKIVAGIESERCRDAYPVKYDAERIKRDFAEVMVKLEDAKAQKETKVTVAVQPAERAERVIPDMRAKAILGKLLGNGSRAAASLTISVMAAALMKHMVK